MPIGETWFVIAAVCESGKYDKDQFCQLVKLGLKYLYSKRRLFSHFSKNSQNLVFSLTHTNRLNFNFCYLVFVIRVP